MTDETFLDLLSDDPGQLKEVILKKTETVLSGKPKEQYSELFQNMRGLRPKVKVPGGLSWIYEQSRRKGPDRMPRVKVGKYL